jgi:hypothetical protein
MLSSQGYGCRILLQTAAETNSAQPVLEVKSVCHQASERVVHLTFLVTAFGKLFSEARVVQVFDVHARCDQKAGLGVRSGDHCIQTKNCPPNLTCRQEPKKEIVRPLFDAGADRVVVRATHVETEAEMGAQLERMAEAVL